MIVQAISGKFSVSLWIWKDLSVSGVTDDEKLSHRLAPRLLFFFFFPGWKWHGHCSVSKRINSNNIQLKFLIWSMSIMLPQCSSKIFIFIKPMHIPLNYKARLNHLSEWAYNSWKNWGVFYSGAVTNTNIVTPITLTSFHTK